MFLAEAKQQLKSQNHLNATLAKNLKLQATNFALVWKWIQVWRQWASSLLCAVYDPMIAEGLLALDNWNLWNAEKHHWGGGCSADLSTPPVR